MAPAHDCSLYNTEKDGYKSTDFWEIPGVGAKKGLGRRVAALIWMHALTIE
jgi:hypothetical protein